MKTIVFSKMKFLGFLLFFCSIILLQFIGQANAVNGIPTFSDKLIKGPSWKDSPPGEISGWDQPQYYSTIGFPDINGDGNADACARGSVYIQCFLSDGMGFPGSQIRGPQWEDGPVTAWNLIQYYSTIQYPDINGDKKADVCARYKDGIICYLSNGNGFDLDHLITGPAWKDGPSGSTDGWDQPQYYSTIQFPDINGDQKADVCGRSKDGIECYISNGTGFSTTLIKGPAWKDSNGWDQPKYNSTIQFPDINGDKNADVCGRSKDGIECYISDGTEFSTTLIRGPAWKDGPSGSTNGWDQPQYYSTIQFPYINSDEKADICGRSKDGINCYLSNETGFSATLINGPAWKDSNGWYHQQYYSTIRFPDINGDGFSDACARGYLHIECFVNGGSNFIRQQIKGPEWSTKVNWNLPQYNSTIEYPDINGDKNADICGRYKDGIECYLSVVPPN
jgi:hypothetical protein